jgi:serine protease Do
MAAIYNLPVGLYVDSVEANGPASKAGIQAEDIIVKLGATRVTSLAELTRALRQYEPGDTTTVTVYRAGAEVELTITLTEKPHTSNAVQPDTEQPQPNGEMPQDGSYEEWYNYFFPFFGKGPQD